MTQKAEQIMNKMREKDRRKRALARLQDSRHRSITMESMNRMDQDETSRVGTNDQEITVPREMDELRELEKENWSRGK